jgi:hypothetical protein
VDTNVFNFLRSFLSECGRIVKFGAGLQNPVRKELTEKLQGICLRCESSYSFVLSGLRPVKEAYGDQPRLAHALRDFAANQEIRDRFKPERFCGEADYILDKLSNNLEPLKYAIPLGKIQSLKRGMTEFQDYDSAMRNSFDEFARSLDGVASDLANPQLKGDDLAERMLYIRSVVEGFEDDLSKTVRDVRDVKNKYLRE